MCIDECGEEGMGGGDVEKGKKGETETESE